MDGSRQALRIAIAGAGLALGLTGCETDPGRPTGAVRRMPLAGGASTTLASGQNKPCNVAVDGAVMKLAK